MKFAPREVPLGGLRAMSVFRTIPHRDRKTIGSWCFIDHYGPDDITVPGRPGMFVPPHPHTGLQTISWLFEGTIEHRDSIGTHANVVPGVTSLMTAGSGIQHSEYATPETTILHGVQLWAVLPNEHRETAPAFHSIPAERVFVDGAEMKVFLGEAFGLGSPVGLFADFFGAEFTIPANLVVRLPVKVGHEHGMLLDSGSLEVVDSGGSETMQPRDLVVVDTGREWIELRTVEEAARGLLLGGVPFEEQIVMWWNFIGRSHEDVAKYRADWQARVEGGQKDGRFGWIDDETEPLPAPEMPGVHLRAR